MQVSTNGYVSFRDPFTNYFDSYPFPLSTRDKIIAPFWDDSDVSSGGQVFFRLSENQTLLNEVDSTINDADFTSMVLFIATWNMILEYDGSPNNVCKL